MIDQIGIAIFGLTAIVLSQTGSLRFIKWAPIFGLLSQPFWFYTTYVNEQWGVFILVFFYTFAWMLGIYNYWVKPYLEKDLQTWWYKDSGTKF